MTRVILSVFRVGLVDGWVLGDPRRDLSVGMTYEDDRLSELYDACVNLGASTRQVTKCLCALRG